MKNIRLSRRASYAAFLTVSAPMLASAPAALAQEQPVQLPEVIITGNPLLRPDGTVAASKLAGDALTLGRKPSLGETLEHLPGVSSTYFGPNASRPVIRGLDGDRIRILQNGGASLDASALSFDHAVPMDAMSIERVEVLRGSAALLYGGSAAGGAVNIIDSRITREPWDGTAKRLSGVGGLVLGSNNSRELNARLDAGTQRFAWHLDGFSRQHQDIRAPNALCDDSSGQSVTSSKICNSALTASGAGVGATLRWDSGYLGTSLSHYGSHYGTVAEPDVRIDLRKQRASVEAEQRFSQGWLESGKAQINTGRYRHTESEFGVTGSLFTNQGSEIRLDLIHREWQLGSLSAKPTLKGSFGVQWERNRFAVDGDEAFVPRTKTQQAAFFWHEELSVGQSRYHIGARKEQVVVDSLGNTSVPRLDLTQGSARFSPHSVSLGANWNVSPSMELSASVARSQRAPKDYELFANGPHIATAAWELGNAALGKEQSTKWEFGAAWKSGAHRMNANVYSSNFSRYIALNRTGRNVGKDGEVNPADIDLDGIADVSGEDIVPEYAYQAVRARLRGFEIQGTWRLPVASSKWTIDWQTDLVRANNLDTKEALPRIAPARIGAGISVQSGSLKARLGAMYYARQNRVPAGDLATPAYTVVNAELSVRNKPSTHTDLLWFIRVDNLSNTRAFSASSILSQTAPGKAPLPGRNVKIGVQGNF